MFIDEANWLNDPDFLSAAKRVFNGDQSKLITSYFGVGPDGNNVEIDLPPMLITLAGNDPIDDDALQSRFDVFTFPKPKIDTIRAFAIELVEAHQDVTSLSGILIDGHITLATLPKITGAIEGLTNFREIQSLIPRLVRSWE